MLTSLLQMTAELGMGANIAIESAVSLCNILHRELNADPNRHPSKSELSAMFAEYQKSRFARAKAFVDLSGKVTRMHSFQSLFNKYFVLYIARYLENFQLGKLAESFSDTPKLDYVPVRTINENSVGWKLAEKKRKQKNNTGAGWLTYAILTSTIGITIAYVATMGLPTLLEL